jgi:hypothetical protein
MIFVRMFVCRQIGFDRICRWGLVNQNPAYLIEFQTTKYDKQIHERFHTSDNESDGIIEYVWPCLIDGYDRTCVAKGVVITDEHNLSSTKTSSHA